MPPARISHFISDDQLAIIEVGSRDRFFDYHLACAGAAIGFFQNVCELIWNGYFGLPLHGWDVYGAILFASFSSAAVCFRMSSNTKDDPVKKVVAEIKKNDKQNHLAAKSRQNHLLRLRLQEICECLEAVVGQRDVGKEEPAAAVAAPVAMD